MQTSTTMERVRWRLFAVLVFVLGAASARLSGRAVAQAICASDDACPADQYCASSGSCTPRCDAAGLCVGPPVSTTLGIASDGTRICFAGAQPDPSSGTTTVWSWDGSSSAPLLLGSTTQLKTLLATDGFCYFAGAVVERAPLRGGGAEELVHEGAAAPTRVWLGPAHVWWTIPVEQGLEVWRAPTAPPPPRRARRARGCVPAPELFALVAAPQRWEAASGSQLFRRVQGSRVCDIISAPLDDLGNESLTRMTYSWACSGDFLTDDQGSFFNQYSGNSYQLHRMDFASWGASTDTGLSSSDYGPVRFLLNGAWIFAARVENPGPGNLYPVTFYRKPTRLDAPKEQLYVAPAGMPSTRAMQFTVLGNALVFVTREARLVVQPIAPLPCSPELPCPEGAGECADDGVCRR
jgi:hypothetical protein